MADAKNAGLVTFVDVEAWGIRLVPAEIASNDDADPRNHGDVVSFPSGTKTQDPAKREGEAVSAQSTCGTPFNNCPVM